MWEWRYSSSILDLHTRRWWLINCMPLPLYPPGKTPLCSLKRRPDGPPSRCERYSLLPTGNWTSTLQSVSRSSTYWATPAHLI
jgi:hypothetical protein